MKNKYISKIINKYFEKRYPEETEKKVQQWLADNQYIEEKKDYLYQYWNTISQTTDSSVQQSLKKVNKKLGIESTAFKIPLKNIFLRVAVIFIPFLLFTLGYIYFSSSDHTNQLLTIVVPNGEYKQVTLPDSSTVWINAGSTISYIENFEGDYRKVQLDGEGYFSVKSDTSKPFIVETTHLSVKVLGTKFNISAYHNNERTITSLDQGRIEVETNIGDRYALEPNQQLVYNHNTNETELISILEENTSGWVNGQLLFKYDTLKDIFLTLERKFDITFIFQDSVSTNSDHFSIKFVNNESLVEILNVLKNIANFSYQINGNQIIITNNP